MKRTIFILIWERFVHWFLAGRGLVTDKEIFYKSIGSSWICGIIYWYSFSNIEYGVNQALVSLIGIGPYRNRTVPTLFQHLEL